MPLYEYRCQGKCRELIEVQQRIVEDPLKECPTCGGELKKLISTSSFQLKGGGWYADSYAGKSNSGS